MLKDNNPHKIFEKCLDKDEHILGVFKTGLKYRNENPLKNGTVFLMFCIYAIELLYLIISNSLNNKPSVDHIEWMFPCMTAMGICIVICLLAISPTKIGYLMRRFSIGDFKYLFYSPIKNEEAPNPSDDYEFYHATSFTVLALLIILITNLILLANAGGNLGYNETTLHSINRMLYGALALCIIIFIVRMIVRNVRVWYFAVTNMRALIYDAKTEQFGFMYLDEKIRLSNKSDGTITIMYTDIPMNYVFDYGEVRRIVMPGCENHTKAMKLIRDTNIRLADY